MQRPSWSPCLSFCRSVCLSLARAFLTTFTSCLALGAQTEPAPRAAREAAPEFDLVIRGSMVADGTGAPLRRADLAIRGGRIAAVGELGASTAKRTIDATGLTLAPGFIDVHTHIDAEMVARPDARNFVAMGVTSVISGNCGGSELDIDKHLDAVTNKGAALNYGTLIGAGTVRNAVLKYARRKPTAAELDQMKELVRKAMQAGAFGLSTGLIYVPGSYAKTEELIELAKVAREHGGLYVTHMRSEEQRVLESIDEALRIGKEAGCPVHISHLKASGKPQWGWSSKIIAKLKEARASGTAVTADQYAYTASSTSLDILFPDAELEIGKKEFSKRLAEDEEFRQKMATALLETIDRAGFGDLSYAQIANAPGHQELAGKTITDAARSFFDRTDKMAQAEAAMKLYADAKGARISMVYHKMCEADVIAFLAQPWIGVASDAGIRSEGTGKPHPRGSGNNVRVLGRYVREQNVISLPAAVQKMTQLPAQTFGLDDRGVVREGAHADLVLFAADRVLDRATYDDPLADPVGIAYVLVNGIPVFELGKPTSARPGQVLRPAVRAAARDPK